MSQFYNNAVFWIEVEKVEPNPYQPRREFDEVRLKDLAESIRMYGILQPLVVTRREVEREDGGLAVEYELISGERRLRAAKLAGVRQVPALIRAREDDARVKLELAIIENLQREDLNPVDRARAFQRFIDEFAFKHHEIAGKIGKSREYVTNSLRLLTLPAEILEALSQGKITEGHARPLMMLSGRPAEQTTVFKEILYKQLTVRDAEAIARRIAVDRARKIVSVDPHVVTMERELQERLGTRVKIEQKRVGGGQILIDFFTVGDIEELVGILKMAAEKRNPEELLNNHVVTEEGKLPEAPAGAAISVGKRAGQSSTSNLEAPPDDRSHNKKLAADSEDPNLYSVRNFTV